ncbi:dephospho-CoA kinase [Magnetospirillum fulvum]|uniref:Dephospho-CoA kinase n=1 Tax=Magnetospirillum fulvum MGU-K5 TaxID=1316936 RepID=S9SEJ9_MAGFU|nr:dephospho-CoA kinase [Magnetospirillum fulvum]EPY03144.1 dephospho-CoA kinase [Magnetospirillum fulvum MGU-K5]
MKIIGLTGSIGTGKSTAARMLARFGLPVHDADATVHALFARGGKAVAAIDAAFPGAVVNGSVDRAGLGRMVFGDRAALKRLEAIVHPLVRAAEQEFLRRQRRRRVSAVVLDIPLLFETGGARRCDVVVVVTCPRFLQAQRVLARPGMSPERLAQIRARQMPEAEKIRCADIVIPTGLGRGPALRLLKRGLSLGSARTHKGPSAP